MLRKCASCLRTSVCIRSSSLRALPASWFGAAHRQLQRPHVKHRSCVVLATNLAAVSQVSVRQQSALNMVDHTSLANFLDARVTHSDLELKVDFEAQRVSGTVKSRVARLNTSKSAVVELDSRGLTIHSVFLTGSGGQQPLAYHLADPHKVLGSKLTIELPAGCTETVEVGIEFTTGPNASALQFLAPEQTAGGKHPYLFTQCQAIHARSLIPCQDTPAVKFTYTAKVTVPKELQALMSALPSGEEPTTDAQAGTRTFSFRQDVPIPSYLLALAVGNLEARQLGPRSKVWSEPSMVEAGLHEFQDTEAFLAAAERLAGPYRWGCYDLLLLPPSFCYGGMENPQLTFVTPTLLAGDRSLANVVAHEIAHSWTGNLVTNASWQDFFLNEGWTVYLERRILGALSGEKTYQFHAALGYMALQETVDNLGSDHPFTALVPDLSGGIDPDDAFSKVPYEKGMYFIHYLQELTGGKDKFLPFFQAYLAHFALKSVSTAEFKQYFLDYFAKHSDMQMQAALKEIDWQTWLYGRGMPPAVNTYDTSLADQAFDLAKAWHTADVMGIGATPPAKASSSDLQGWSSAQIVAFLDKYAQLRSMQPPHPSTTRAMNRLYGFDGSKNAEIRASWYRLCITAGDTAISDKVAEFLKEQGRMKYLRPLYRALFKSKAGKQLALDTFSSCRSSYHPIAAKMVAADLQVA